MTLDEVTQLDPLSVVSFVEDRLIGAINAGEAARCWRTLLEFRTAIYVSGLWQAYGNYCEQGELEGLRRAFEFFEISDLLGQVETGSEGSEVLEDFVTSAISDEVLRSLVVTHWRELRGLVEEGRV